MGCSWCSNASENNNIFDFPKRNERDENEISQDYFFNLIPTEIYNEMKKEQFKNSNNNADLKTIRIINYDNSFEDINDTIKEILYRGDFKEGIKDGIGKMIIIKENEKIFYHGIWDKLFAAQEEKNKSLPQEPIKITLPDGKEVDGTSNVTTPYNVAEKHTKKSVLKEFLVAKVTYTKKVSETQIKSVEDEEQEEKCSDKSKESFVLWDMHRPLIGDCKLEFCNFETKEGQSTFWHSSAHLLGSSIETAFGAKLCIGPALEEGFYYDSYMGSYVIDPSNDYKTIEEQVKKNAQGNHPFTRLVMTKKEALELFKANPFKELNEYGEPLGKETYKPDEWDDEQFIWEEKNLKPGYARPCIVHRAILGSVERCSAILIEHFGGKFPFWLSPKQICICTINKDVEDYAEKWYLMLKYKGYQVFLDKSSATLQKKVRNSQIAQFNFTGVIGKEEVEGNTIDIRNREGERIGKFTMNKLIEYFQSLEPKPSKVELDLLSKVAEGVKMEDLDANEALLKYNLYLHGDECSEDDKKLYQLLEKKDIDKDKFPNLFKWKKLMALQK